MNALRQWPIGARLGLGFALLIAAILLLAGITTWKLKTVNQEVSHLLDDRMVKVEQITRLKDNANVVARAVRNIAMLAEVADQNKEKARMAEIRQDSDAIYAKLEAGIQHEDGRRALAALVEARKPYVTAINESVTLSSTGRRDEAAAMLITQVRPLQTNYFKALDDLRTLQTQKMKASAATVGALNEAVMWTAGLTALTAAMVGAGLAWAITRSITQPLHQAMTVAQAVAQGDLRSPIPGGGQDETGQLLGALRGMNDSLLRIVSQVRQSSDSIATGTAQIATGNSDLSQRTEMQAANLQQTVASMEELASTVQQSADTARTANQLAQTASESASRGGAVVAQVVQTMDGITASSRKISDIIGVIDGIAFQTNILALNAAVEAARAGEQGRGFAVVASEVRTLASRSAEAAREIKSLIGQSVTQVESGAALVNQAGEAMGDIVRQVQRVSDLIGEISAATQEQTQGIAQVASAASQLDEVTQQNAALVEESAAAAGSLQQQAGSLAQMVAVFRV
ncbi:methyl-accepting chemotaxis protein [Aquabacterium sp.]|uniref:methyl-accepting chemotaxis protein n=1 Tax=Aquabacterium sp. TaxID=1872578 RepID=UPI0025BC1AC5|nr:methyl-accepting chemotaxis protein [Aquabacterium sp.]